MRIQAHSGGFMKIALRIMSIVMILMLVSVSALASFKADVYSSSMDVYDKPSTSANKLGSLDSGTEVKVTAYSGDWAKISYKGHTGYALIKCLSSQKRAKVYTKSDASVYKAASTASKKLGTLSEGVTLYLVGKSGSFYLVENNSGKASGYIYKSYLTNKKPAADDDDDNDNGGGGNKDDPDKDPTGTMPSSLRSSQKTYRSSLSNSAKLEYVIYVAQSQLGDPYSYDPTAPSSFDCAGLVRYCFGKAGISLNGSAYSQGYDTSFTKISSASNLKRGDMVCFNTNEDDDDLSDHTGIYLGNGYFIHASSGAGKVIVSNLTTGYYERVFSWGLRILG